MSARDAESGSSTYKGGSGRAGGLGNGGIGGGMGGGGNWGGGLGGGAGRMGGVGNRTGLTTGNQMFGGMAMGRPGGMAMNPGAWGIEQMPGIMQGPLAGRTKPAVSTPIPASVPGVNPTIEDVPMPSYTPNVFNQNYLNSIVDFRNAVKNRYGQANPSWGSITDVYSKPLQKDLANIDWSGQPKNIQAMQGGYGATAYSNGGNGYRSWSGAPRKGGLGGGY